MVRASKLICNITMKYHFWLMKYHFWLLPSKTDVKGLKGISNEN
jgi:hypothetical protein